MLKKVMIATFSLISLSPTKTKKISSKNLLVTGSSKNTILYNNLLETKTPNQEKFNEIMNDDRYKIVICMGPAGVGKTLLSCNYAINNIDKYNQFLLTKPLISVDNEQLGFLPGDLKSKMSVWGENYIEMFQSLYSKTEIQKLIKNEFIKIKPMAYLRGKTFTNSLIISDEMQNSSPVQLKMLMSRLGINSKLILLGDIQQKDIKQESGFEDFLYKFETYKKHLTEEAKKDLQIKIIEMNESDVLRSDIVKQVLDIYNFDVVKKRKEREEKEEIPTKNEYPFEQEKEEEKEQKEEKLENNNVDILLKKNNDSSLFSIRDYKILKKYNIDNF